MKKIVYILALVAALVGCKSEPTFKVNGTLSGVEAGKVVYLEQISITQTMLLDSVKLGKNNSFSFKSPAPKYPELYRLRVGDKSIVLAIDSTEEVKVSLAEADFLTATIENSAASEKIAALRKSLRDNTLEEHKTLAKQAILEDLQAGVSLVSYYALYQLADKTPIFDIENREDRRIYQAVVTSMDAKMPNDPRAKELHDKVIAYMNAERRQLNNETMLDFIKSQENSFIDITLPDQNGDEQAMSQYQGKVIMLDFCSMELENYQAYNLALRERYNKYHSKGLEIYQVYANHAKMLWEEQVDALPWMTVWAEYGFESIAFRNYNVNTIPTLYLLNRKGEVVKRISSFTELDAAIEKLL